MLEMQRIQPEIKKIQAKYKNDKVAQQEALSQLFKENKVSPAGGCLPMLAQFPLLYVMYQVIRGLSNTVGSQVSPKYISHSTSLYQSLISSHGQMQSLGLNLSETATKVHGFGNALPYYLVIAVAVVLQYLQMAQLTSKNPQAAAANPQAQMLQKYTPIIFAVIYISIPAGVNVYFIVSALFRIGQQELMYRHDPVLKKHLQASAEARLAGTQEIEHVKPKQGFRALLSAFKTNAAPKQTEAPKPKPAKDFGTSGRKPNSNGTNKPGSGGQRKPGQGRPRGQEKNDKGSQ